MLPPHWLEMVQYNNLKVAHEPPVGRQSCSKFCGYGHILSVIQGAQISLLFVKIADSWYAATFVLLVEK